LKVAGLMSGTSLDGVDAVVLEIRGERAEELAVRVLAFHTEPYSDGMRDRLRTAMDQGSPRELARLHRELGRAFASALGVLLETAGIAPGEVAAVGSHGQTFWHDPPRGRGEGATLQLGCAATVAEALGVPVVADFRSRDVAAGGQGAPLVPWADWVLLRRSGVGRAVQNLGGMGNVTFLPADGRLDGVRAFDTGPGVALLDGAAWRASGGRETFDRDGRRARRGGVREDLLAELLRHPFLATPPPRSTGREEFGEAFLDSLLRRASPSDASDWDDLLATLTRFTAEAVAESFRRFLPEGAVDEVVLAGGGARNPVLRDALRTALAPLPVRTGAEALGVDPDAREAAAFALLAWAHLKGVPANVPAATGASGPRVLGSLTPGAGGRGP
jgi:anhydro-N-acetylmuramic acid kinase